MLVILQHKIVNFESVRFLEKSEMGYRFVFSKEDFVDTDLDDEDIQSVAGLPDRIKALLPS